MTSVVHKAGDADTTGILVSFQPGMELLAEREIHQADPRSRLSESLEPGLWRVVAASDDRDARRLISNLHERFPIAIRHLHPVQVDNALSGNDLVAEIVEALAPLGEKVEGSWSVQTRVVGGALGGAKAYDVNDALAARIGATGYDRKQPEQVVSVCVVPGRVFAGVSSVKDNLSSWPGGAARYAGGPDALSRAKKKLMEALDVFGLELPSRGTAVDLGAAPGGWTQLLLEKGWRVIAVDPAALDERLDSDGLTQVKTTAERYLASARETVDLIVSDMRMDARDAARLMLEYGRLLRPDGLIITTLKLPERGFLSVLDTALAILGERYSVRARQLFHNRSEVTAVLTPH